MGLRPTQGDKNRVEEAWLVITPTLSSRPECSRACGPPKGMKIGLKKARLAITPSFVISTGAQRSGEICGFSHIWRKERARYGVPSIRGRLDLYFCALIKLKAVSEICRKSR